MTSWKMCVIQLIITAILILIVLYQLQKHWKNLLWHLMISNQKIHGVQQILFWHWKHTKNQTKQDYIMHL